MKRISLGILFLSTILQASVVSVGAGAQHTCAVTDGGALYCWGKNQQGQLGLGDMLAHMKPTRVPLADGEHALDVGAGLDHTCALFKGGYVKCWGVNQLAQLGLGVTIASVGGGFNQEVAQLPPIDLGKDAKVKKLSVGHYHNCVLLESNAVKCWGYNAVGALGIGDARNRGNAVADMGDNLAAVDFGKDLFAVDITSGFANNCVTLNTGAVKCWGDYRGIGAGKVANIGIGAADMGDNLKPLDLGTKARIKKVASGTYHTCFLFDDGKVKCFGQNIAGALGIGKPANDIVGDAPNELGSTLPYVNLSTTKTVTALFANGAHTCVLLEDQTVKCWGQNSGGQLGLGDATARGLVLDQMGDKLPTVNVAKVVPHSLFLGHAHTCLLADDGKLRCWGTNTLGQLGTGNTTTLGTQPSHMGDALRPLVFE